MITPIDGPIDATGYDDPATGGTDEGTVTIGGLIVNHPTGGLVSGTGGYTPFLRQNDNSGTTQGFNTDDAAATASNNSAGLDMQDSWTQALHVGDLPVTFINGLAYYEIRLDINEENSGTDANGQPNILLGLSELQIYTSDRQATLSDYNSASYETRALGSDFNLAYDLDSGGDKTLVLTDGPSGSGNDDYVFYIPVTALGDASATDYFTLFAQFGPNPAEGATFEEFRVRSSSHIEGVKFADVNHDGIQEANGADGIANTADDEAGLAGFQMYIDSNGNNQYDVGELTATSDANGHFTFYGLSAGSYVVRENMTGTQSDNYILTTGDGTGDHVVTITTGNASVSVGNMPIIRDFTITKAVTGVTGDTDADGSIDQAGGVISYIITITNSGNVALTGYTFSDANATTISGLSGDTNGNGNLDVGETWTYSASHTVTQAELDGKGTGVTGAVDGDGDTDNRATASFDIVGSKSSDVSTPLNYTPAIDVTKAVTSVTGTDGNNLADHCGDVISYAITIANTGNISLTGVAVNDAVESYGATDAVGVMVDGHNSGDANGNGTLDVGETWNYTASYTLTQGDLDGRGGGDTTLDNTATGDTDQTNPDSASASVPLVYNPAIDVTKTVTSVTGSDGNDKADHAGDVISYAITIANTGNISLTGVTVNDAVEGYGATDAVAVMVDGHNSGDGNANGVLDVGETWNYTASYTLTQGDLDGRGGGNGQLDNSATGDTAQTDPDSSSASVPLTYAPQIDLEKAVSVDGGATWDDADAALGPQDVNLGAPVSFQVTVTNDGNVSLTDLLITDVNTSNGGNVSSTLYSGGTLMAGATLTGDVGNDHVLSVGETWTISYTQGFDPGDHVNTATVTTTQGATDTDAAHYYSLASTGPGVRTPGFWSNLGATFWDGIANNEPKQAGTPGFAKGELLYAVDSNNDGLINGSDKVGLLIGDYNHDGLTGPGEDTLFISLKDAQALINASNKDVSGDARFMLGRDMVATWLNYLEGNGVGAATDPQSPHHYLDQAIDWMQTYSGGTGSTSVNNETFDSFVLAGNATKSSSSTWTGHVTLDGMTSDLTASQMHGGLDYYNNTGMTSPTSAIYAGDSDDSTFLSALSVYQHAHLI